MRLGFSIPQVGNVGGPAATRAVCERAEALGYDSLWVLDRLLRPVAAKTPYPVTADGQLPEAAKRVLDPIGLLTFAAACTKRARLGTSVLNLPYYNPVLLARALTTVDVLSEGRLSVGFGTGWSQDEYDAVGVDMKTRGARANEALDLLEKYWTEDAPEHHGQFYTLPKCHVARPVQRPRPRVYLAAFVPATLKRVAERADGWNPAGLPLPVMKDMWGAIRGMAAAAGRDPETLELVVRANLDLRPGPVGGERPPFVGSAAQIRDDIQATREMGAHELAFDGHFSTGVKTVSDHVALLEQLRELAG